MSWGNKPIVDHWLDEYINHSLRVDGLTTAEEIEEFVMKEVETRAIKGFAWGAKTVSDFGECVESLKSCKAQKESYQDVYYIIDHTHLSAGAKLILKLIWIFV